MIRWRRVILLTIGIALFGWLIWRVRGIATPFVLAAIITYVLLPLVDILERHQCGRGLAILLLYCLLALVATFLWLWFVPVLSAEIEALAKDLPHQTARLEEATERWLAHVGRSTAWSNMAQTVLHTINVQGERMLLSVVNRLLTGVTRIFTSAFHLLLAPFIAFFLMRDWPLMQDTLLGMLPVQYVSPVRTVASEVNRVLSGYIRGQLIVSLLVGAIIAAGLSLLNVKYAILVGLIAGLFEIVPYFGPIIGAVPAVALALMQSPSTVLWTIALFVIINQLESMVLAPKIVGDYVGLHPLTVVIAILAGAELAGIWGMLVGVPVTAVTYVIGSAVWQFAVTDQLNREG